MTKRQEKDKIATTPLREARNDKEAGKKDRLARLSAGSQ